MLKVTVTSYCDTCENMMQKETLLNACHQPIWSGMSDKMNDAGWKFKLNEKKDNWLIECVDCRKVGK